jgi:L-lysine 2,3-aminomutase
MYIDNEKEKYLWDINAALRKVDHLDTMVKMEEKEKEKKETSRLPPAQGFHTGN